jgi:ketosteroid isomerase-like protein
MDERLSDEDVTVFVRRAEEAADAWMRGDMERYLDLVHHARGFTLLPPTGGPATRHDDRAEGVRASAGWFLHGAARLEHVETHAWGDTIVLVAIERQHGEVGGLPDQEWPLRVTHVYRRDGTDWQLVHRHADPLVSTIEVAELAALARRGTAGQAMRAGDENRTRTVSLGS